MLFDKQYWAVYPCGLLIRLDQVGQGIFTKINKLILLSKKAINLFASMDPLRAGSHEISR